MRTLQDRGYLQLEACRGSYLNRPRSIAVSSAERRAHTAAAAEARVAADGRQLPCVAVADVLERQNVSQVC